MKIAIYDYLVVGSNPAGLCHRILLKALSDEHEFTVFSHAFDNPSPKRISWVKIPSIRRPLAALFLSFHLGAILRHLTAKWSRKRFGLVQSVESNVAFGDLVYSHFCHRWFLKHRWRYSGAKGFRGVARWFDHVLHAIFEPIALRRAKWIVSPSQGLARELCEEYPFVRQKIHVIANPVDLESYTIPADFDRAAVRNSLGIQDHHKVAGFVALGHFELKGLPILMRALAKLDPAGWKLLVVGGMPNLVETYKRLAETQGLDRLITFVGTQKDIRPYLWASDLFALPSAYEVFPLSVLQAAAAARPILVTNINGVEEFLVDGESCFQVNADEESVASGLRRFEALTAEERNRVGASARKAAESYGIDRFASSWRTLYQSIEEESARG